MTLAPISLWIRIFALQRGMLTSTGLDFCRILVSWITGNCFVEGGVSVCCREGLRAEVSYSFVLMKRELSDTHKFCYSYSIGLMSR